MQKGKFGYTAAGLLNPFPYPTSTNLSAPPHILQPDDSEVETYYTVFMIDPDAKSVTSKQQTILHWFVANVKGNGKGLPLDFSESYPIASYLKPGPNINSGLHRETILVYRQQQFQNPSVFPLTTPGTNVYGISTGPTVSNGRYYLWPVSLLSAFFDQMPALVAMNYMYIYNLDQNQKNFPQISIQGKLKINSTGSIVDIEITNIGRGYIIGPPTITITGCTSAKAVFLSSAINSGGTLAVSQPLSIDYGLSTASVSILSLLQTFQPGYACSISASVSFSAPPEITSNN